MIKRRLTLLATALMAATSARAIVAPPDLEAIADSSRGYVYGWSLDQTTQPGRVLMRLSTAVGNHGTGPMEIFGGPVSGSVQQVYQRVYDSNGTFQDRLAGNFVYHPTHSHLHLEGFATYNLRTITTGGGVGGIIAAGAKTSFCLINVTQYWPSTTSSALVPHGRGGGSCGQVQGISAGYADVYSSGLQDQWIDVTSVPSGSYWLEVIADPDNHILESNESNNVVRIQVNYTNPTGGTTNRAPVVSNPGAQSSARGSAVTLDITASDPDGQPVTFSASGLPLGLSISQSTGRISGTISMSAAASYSTTVIASDGQLQGSTTFTWTTTAPLNGTGLRAQYYSGTALSSLVFTRTDALVDFTWGTGSPGAGVPADNFSARWSGRVIPPATGAHTFIAQADDGVRLWINGQQIINSWVSGGLATRSGTASLTAGQEADIVVEYFESTGSAEMHLSWSGPGFTQQVIPTNRLIPAIGNEAPTIFNPGPQTGVAGTVASLPINATDPNGDTMTYSATGLPTGLSINSATGVISGTYAAAGNFSSTVTVRDASLSASTNFAWTVTAAPQGTGLHAEYFNDRILSNEIVHRVDPVVDFNWGTGAPATGMNVDDFSMRWNGELLPQYSQAYTFKVVCDGGVRLWVNNMPMFDQWTPTGALQTYTATWNLTANQRTAIRLEYNDSTGNASVRLLWSSASQPEQVIPTARLFPTEYQPPPDTTPPSVNLTTPSATVSTSFPVNVNFSESVLGLTASDFVITNGTATLTSTTNSHALSVTPAAPGLVSIFLPAGRCNDASGNPNTASNTLNVTYAPATGIFTPGDIGSVGFAGSTSFANTIYTVRGSGSDIYGAEDSFHFARTTLTGDGEIIARVTGLTNTAAWAKAGVMIRESLTASSRHAIMYAPPYESGNITEMMWRQTAGGVTAYFDGPAQNAPPNNWVRLVRSGNNVTGYYSSNGTSWARVQTVTFTSLPATLYFGLCVSSANNAQLATATFDSVRVATIAPSAPLAPAGLAASAISASDIRLAWTDVATNESSYVIERGLGTGAAVLYTTIATLPADTTSYTDTGLSASTAYSYKVSASNSLGLGTAGPVSATTASPSGTITTGVDIGNVGAAGSTTLSQGGVYTVRGSGADIFGTADSFHFASTTLTGDGEIRARVSDQTFTASWAKAGVMIRENLAPGSRHAIAYTTPFATGNGAEMMWRQTTGGDTAYTDTIPMAPPPNNWVRLVRTGNTITGYYSANGSAWIPFQAAAFASLPATLHFGLCVSSNAYGAISTATFTNVSVTSIGGPSPLVGTDIGSPAIAGSTQISSGGDIYTVRGSGADIYGVADSFHFAYRTLTGDGDIRVRVASQTNTAAWAKAGLMMRETLGAGSRHAILYTTPYETGNGTEMMWRQNTGGETVYFDGVPANPPPNNWLCLERIGNTIRSYVSANGTNWTLLRSVTFTSLPATLNVGLCVCSTNNSVVNTATFDNLQIVSFATAAIAQSTQNTLTGAGDTASTTTGTLGGSLPGITMPELTGAQAADGGISLSFVRPAFSSATYRLQVIQDLAASPAGWRTSATRPVITPNADGTSTVMFSGLPAELVSAPRGFARIHAELDADGDGFADVERTSDAFGFSRHTLATGSTTLGQPFAPAPVITTSIISAGAASLTLAAQAPVLAGGEYYAEIIRGAHEGQRIELDEAATRGAALALDLAHARSTLHAIPSSIVGDTIVIRRHHTLGQLLPASAFTGSSNPATADRIAFFTGSAFETLWVLKRADGTRQWTRQGDATLADASARVLDVTGAAVVTVRGAAVPVTLSGFVRPSAIAAPLKAGAQLLPNPWPFDVSPRALGMTTARGFVGTSNPASADKLQLWKGDQDPALTGYETFYLLNSSGLNQWTAQGDATLADHSDSPLVLAMRAAFIKSVNNKPAFTFPCPWTP